MALDHNFNSLHLKILLQTRRDDALSTMTAYELEHQGSVPGQWTPFFATTSRPAAQLTKHSAQFVAAHRSPRVQRAKLGAITHINIDSMLIKNAWNYTSNPAHAFTAWCLRILTYSLTV
jgi:hypothetical protein